MAVVFKFWMTNVDFSFSTSGVNTGNPVHDYRPQTMLWEFNVFIGVCPQGEGLGVGLGNIKWIMG